MRQIFWGLCKELLLCFGTKYEKLKHIVLILISTSWQIALVGIWVTSVLTVMNNDKTEFFHSWNCQQKGKRNWENLGEPCPTQRCSVKPLPGCGWKKALTPSTATTLEEMLVYLILSHQINFIFTAWTREWYPYLQNDFLTNICCCLILNHATTQQYKVAMC